MIDDFIYMIFDSPPNSKNCGSLLEKKELVGLYGWHADKLGARGAGWVARGSELGPAAGGVARGSEPGARATRMRACGMQMGGLWIGCGPANPDWWMGAWGRVGRDEWQTARSWMARLKVDGLSVHEAG